MYFIISLNQSSIDAHVTVCFSVISVQILSICHVKWDNFELRLSKFQFALFFVETQRLNEGAIGIVDLGFFKELFTK